MSNASDINTLEEFAAVPLKEKLAYFFGEMLSQSLFYYLVLTLSIYFYTDVMHISATTIGIVVIVSRIFDAFTDLLIGTLVDRTKSRLGKARAWVIFMTAPYALSMFLLYCVPASWTTAHQIAYIVITYNLAVTVCYTFENIPWGTLSILMSRDRVQRSQLSALRMAGSPIACALGVGIALPAINALGGTQHDWMKIMAIFAVVGIVAPTSLGVQMVSAVIRSIGWGLLAALIHSMVGDAIEYGHWRTGHKAPGTTYAAQGVGNKLGVLIGSGVTTLILGASGYDGAAAAQVASALSTIKGVYLYLPLAFAVVIFFIMCFYKLNSKNYNHIVSELEQGRYHPNAKYAPHSEA